MPVIILSGVLFLSMALFVFLAAYTMIYCESKNKVYFAAMQIPAFIYTAGYLLEVTANSPDGALTAAKVMYLGSNFVLPMFLVFIAKYCDIKIKKYILALIFGIALLLTGVVWTTEHHGLFYASYWYIYDLPFPEMGLEPGPMYPLPFIITFICLFYVIGILVYKYVKTDAAERHKSSFLSRFAFATGFIIVSMVVFILNPINSGLNYIVLAIVVFNILNFVNIIRNDMFDIISRAAEMAADSMHDAYIVVDGNKRLLKVNESAQKFFPFVAAMKKYDSLSLAQGFPSELLSITGQKSYPSIIFTASDKHYEASISPINKKSGNLLGYVILIRDITESVMLTQKLEEIAYTDTLTNIMNRRHFIAQAVNELERIKRSGINSYIIIFDLDNFKQVNDTYGHLIGDKVLICTADRVRRVIRPYDLFARYGGEEFIMLVSDISRTDIEVYAERLRELINIPMEFDDLTINISASFGIAPITNDSFESIVKTADDALYRAKDGGRNRFVLAEI